MVTRTLSILTLLALVTFGSIWFFSRKPVSTGQAPIDALIIGTNTEYPPFSFMDKETIAGFDIDVAKEIAKRVGKPFTFKSMSFDALIPELQTGSIHIIAAGMTPTPERAKRALFTSSHLEGDPLIAVQPKDASPIDTAEQLSGKRVVVNQGYSSDHFVTDLEGVEVIRVSSPLISTGLLTVDGGQADVYVAAKSSLQPFLEKKHEEYLVTPIKDTAEASALAVSKKYPQLYSSIQSSMNEMIKDGTLASLKKKWKLND